MSVTFCSRYMEGGHSRSYWSRKNESEIDYSFDKEGSLFPNVGNPYGKVEAFLMDDKTWVQAHRYVLFNCESNVVENYKREHINDIKRSYRKRRLTQHQLDRLHFDSFHEWFKDQVNDLESTFDISKDLKALAQGPSYIARRFKAFDVNNGYRFRTKKYEEFRKTQNSGVMVVSKTESYASTSDNAPKSANVVYYGRLSDIIELDYFEEFKVVLFKCDWVDVTRGRGLKVDEWGFTLVNFSHLIHSGDRESHEPFVFANQAQQVIFVQDPHDHHWFVPRLMKPRDTFDMGEVHKMQFSASLQNDTMMVENICQSEDDHIDWVRNDVDGVEIENSSSSGDEADNDEGNENEYGSDSE
ncbi:uncharacterized protein LOC130745771 [Lotus japonicus]|uniref:uncharacterized protein LOC130745771 n=1 Tax=Lotus japonicus TaxID=34305 RepID=UPI0025896AC0|nr:uncharacterized protein LOC130745771 [Lotus japonicus]XP_057454145.1 uncharacterized protein LOC130745771 [Lotus japonicus]